MRPMSLALPGLPTLPAFSSIRCGANVVRHEFTRTVLRPAYRWARGKPRLGSTDYDIDWPEQKVRRVLERHRMGYNERGEPRWWLQAMDGRNTNDELTHAEFDFVAANVPKAGEILVTGCGQGLSTLWFSQRGFRHVEGFDYLDYVVDAAREIAKLPEVEPTLAAPISYWQDDGYAPKLTKQYDCITAMHWVYSAWNGGSYGDVPARRGDRLEILTEFLSQYAPYVKPGGHLLLELVDAALDVERPDITAYPIRHSSQQVACAAKVNGLTVRDRVRHQNGQRPFIVLYILRR